MPSAEPAWVNVLNGPLLGLLVLVPGLLRATAVQSIGLAILTLGVWAVLEGYMWLGIPLRPLTKEAPRQAIREMLGVGWILVAFIVLSIVWSLYTNWMVMF